MIGILAVTLGACVATPPPSAPMTESSSGDAALPNEEPEDDEDRAQAVLSDLEAWCADHEPECGAVELPDVYPNVEVPAADRRYIDDRREELRSLGVQVRWDPSTSRFEIVRGNTPMFDGDLRDDP